jgi:hypothetical protein
VKEARLKEFITVDYIGASIEFKVDDDGAVLAHGIQVHIKRELSQSEKEGTTINGVHVSFVSDGYIPPSE